MARIPHRPFNRVRQAALINATASRVCILRSAAFVEVFQHSNTFDTLQACLVTNESPGKINPRHCENVLNDGKFQVLPWVRWESYYRTVRILIHYCKSFLHLP